MTQGLCLHKKEYNIAVFSNLKPHDRKRRKTLFKKLFCRAEMFRSNFSFLNPLYASNMAKSPEGTLKTQSEENKEDI